MYNLTTTCRFGGVESFVWEISRELARRGEEVHIFGGRGKVHHKISGVRVRLFPFWPRENIPNLGRRFRKLVERWSMGALTLSPLLRERYDLVHIHKPFDLPLGWVIKKLKGTKLILGSHGTDFFPGDRIFIPAVDRVVSCSYFNASQIRIRYGVSSQVIYNGVDPKVFRPLSPDLALRQRLGIPKGSRVVVFAGRVIGLKGVHVLLRAMTHLNQGFPWRLIIIGEGEAQQDLKRLSQKLGIREKIVFTGYIPNHELPGYYSFADLAVYPSIADESFGMVICEAMACGLPVVSTMVGGIPEVIQDGVTGLLASPKDSRDLAIKVSSLLNDDQLRQKMREAGRKRVLENFAWEKVADRLQQVYRETLLRKSR